MVTITATLACTGFGTWLVARLATATVDAESIPEQRRREKLRHKSVLFRECEWPVLALAAILRRWAGSTVARAEKSLAALGEEDWRAEEYLAVLSVWLWTLMPVVAIVSAFAFGPVTCLGSIALFVVAVPLYAARLTRKWADDRVREIRNRLPHTLEVMALVLEAGGGTLFDCLEFGAEENAGNPLGTELRRVVHAIAQSLPPQVVLAEMSKRLADPDVAEVNLAIATSETHGPPLKTTLRDVAARLRIRQIQWLEQASEKAKVHILWPVLLVMVACLTIIAAPIVLGGFSIGRDLIP